MRYKHVKKNLYLVMVIVQTFSTHTMLVSTALAVGLWVNIITRHKHRGFYLAQILDT